MKIFESVESGGKHAVMTYEKGKTNPYRVYHIYYTAENGRVKKHRKMIVKYADLTSALFSLIDYYNYCVVGADGAVFRKTSKG